MYLGEVESIRPTLAPPERLGDGLVQEVEPREIRRRLTLTSLAVVMLIPGAGRDVLAAPVEHVGQLAPQAAAGPVSAMGWAMAPWIPAATIRRSSTMSSGGVARS
jgi:hypothetical protein